HQVAVPVQQARDTLLRKSLEILAHRRQGLDNLSQYFRSASLSVIERHERLVANTAQGLHTAANSHLIHEQYAVGREIQVLESGCAALLKGRQHELSAMEHVIRILDPQQMLNRGYSMTLYQGKVVRDAS